MARYSNLEHEEKQSQGKQLFAKSFSLKEISKLLNVTEKTLRGWRDKYKWQEEKELAALKPSRIKRLILESVMAIEKGEPLPYKADDISKIVAAFDRITDNRKVAVYTMESLDNLTNFSLELAAKTKGKNRQRILEQIKGMRLLSDKFISKLLQDDY